MDQISDTNGVVLHRLVRQYALDEFIKTAAVDADEISALPSSSFADARARELPCHTREHTVISYAYFVDDDSGSGRNRSDVESAFSKFAQIWNVEAEMAEIRNRRDKHAADLSTMPDDVFAVVHTHNGERYRSLPLLNDECVKRAAAHLRQFRDRYPLDCRCRAAERIMSKAAEFGVTIRDPYIVAASRQTLSPAVEIAHGLMRRAKLTDDAEQKTAMLKLARAIAVGRNTWLCRKAASVMDRFDATNSLRHMYSRGLPTPEEICYRGVTVKQAEAVRDNFVQLTTGTAYSKSALADAGLSPYRVLGDDFIEQIRVGDDVNVNKAAELVPTLPRGEAELLDRAMRAAGVPTFDQQLKSADVQDDIADWSNREWERALELSRPKC